MSRASTMVRFLATARASVSAVGLAAACAAAAGLGASCASRPSWRSSSYMQGPAAGAYGTSADFDARSSPSVPARVAALHSACGRALDASPPMGMLLFARRGEDHLTLFGTIHMGTREDAALTPGVLCYLDAASRAGVEVDLDPRKAGEAMRSLAAARERALGRPITHYPPGRTLEGALGPRTYGRLVSLLPPGTLARTAAALSRIEGHDVAPERLSEQTVSGLANALSSNALASEKGAEVAHAPDFVVYERAKRAGKPLHFLESFEEQLRVLASFDDEGAGRVAERLIRTGGPDGLLRANATFYDVWKTGVDEAGARRAWDAMEPDVHRRMFLARNRGMAESAARCAGPGGCFVAVGFGHLIGREPIQEHLEEMGFEIHRLK